MQSEKPLYSLIWLLLYTLVLMAPAFYNGYPLVYSDTGTYIQCGIQWTLPIDRPFMYGFFIRISSLGFSLWNVIFFQCLLLAYTLFMSTRILIGDQKQFPSCFLIGLLFLVAFTGLGWYACQLMPDIFTPISILCLFLLLQYPKIVLKHRILLSFILVFSICTHFSNLIITGSLFILVFIIHKIRFLPGFAKQIPKFRLVLLLLFSCPLLTSVLNYSVSGSFAMSKSIHVFLMGRLLDSGVLTAFLQEKCVSGDYALCEYKDSLPRDSRAFLWDGKSPLVRQGGWEATAKPYWKIIWGIVLNPKYAFLWCYNSLTAAASQCFQNTIGSDLVNEWYAMPNSPPYKQIAKHFGHELNPYLQSRQNIDLWNRGLNFTLLNNLHYVLLSLSLFFLVMVLAFKSLRQTLSPEIKLFIFILITGILLNAFFTAALANIYDRLQGRVSWLWVLMGLVVLFYLFSKKVSIKKDL